jgi:LmbE family N-acetylglucosaminyl deacetylase
MADDASGVSGPVAPPMWGSLPDGALDRVMVVSPHFDDAALGTAHLLCSYPGSTVVTVCAGWPAAYPNPPSEWDALGGFHTGDDVVAIRREEDRAAMEVLDADPVWLDFVDHQYLEKHQRARPEQIADALAAVIDARRPSAVFVPMGLANPDHELTHAAGALLAATRPDVCWLAYEDHGYKHIPGMLAWRVAKLFHSGLWPTPAIVPVEEDHERKRDAVYRYVSQIPPLERDHGLGARLDGRVPEQHWRLAPPPSGWERLTER